MVIVVLALLGLAKVGHAERSAALSATGSCPTREALLEALHLALPDITIVADPSGTELRIVVTEHADSYRVVVAGVVRTFIDAARQCDSRARKVSVVVALALDPPVIEDAIDRPNPDSAVAAPKQRTVVISTMTVLTAQAAPPSDFDIHVETGGVVAGAPAGGKFTAGLDMHVVFGREGVGLVVGGALTSLSQASAPDGTVVLRLSIDVAVRIQTGSALSSAALELGPRFTIQQPLPQKGSFDAYMATNWPTESEAGVRGAVRLESWPQRAFGLFATLQAEFVPIPSRIPMLQTGRGVRDVGRMPHLWVGPSIGLVLRVL
jgi:hypothetical protein